jgi:hypothetical protein
MKPLSCAAVARRLHAFHDQELPIGEQISVSAHLEACAACAAELSELRLLAFTLRASMPGRAALTTDEDASFQASVVSRMTAEEGLSFSTQLRQMFDDMHLVYAGLGAAAAAVVCAVIMLGMMQFALEGPGSNGHPVAVRPFVRMPRAIDDPFVSQAVGGADTMFTFTGVVTREGVVEHLELLNADGGAPRGSLDEAKLLEDLMGAVAKARFEPASVAGAPIAVNMVWIVAHTTVRASKVSTVLPHGVEALVLARHARAMLGAFA